MRCSTIRSATAVGSTGGGGGVGSAGGAVIRPRLAVQGARPEQVFAAPAGGGGVGGRWLLLQRRLAIST